MDTCKLIKYATAASLACLIFANGSALASKKAQGHFTTTNSTTFNSYNTGINDIRLQALRETATTLGAQSGLAWKAKNINATLHNESDHLNQVFNFNALLLKNRLLPPVLVQADNEVNQSDSDTIRLSDKIYKIIEPARLVTIAPNWRTYLLLDYQSPESPNHTLLPKNKHEVAVWNAYMKKGWQEGVEQAQTIFSLNLNRLKRDFKGMILYKKMVLNQMISAPHVSKADLGVTGDEKEMRINDQIVRITMHSKLQLNSKRWDPVLTN